MGQYQESAHSGNTYTHIGTESHMQMREETDIFGECRFPIHAFPITFCLNTGAEIRRYTRTRNLVHIQTADRLALSMPNRGR